VLPPDADMPSWVTDWTKFPTHVTLIASLMPFDSSMAYETTTVEIKGTVSLRLEMHLILIDAVDLDHAWEIPGHNS
jgi:hypothetical protein